MAEKSYWNEFYRASNVPLIPSQFAAFTLSEIEAESETITGIIELGCGNGRDSLFFARYGHEVIGFDQSASAIHSCNQLAAACKNSPQFFAKNITDIDYETDIVPHLKQNTIYHIYSRFFLHAINEAEEQIFMQLAGNILARHKSLLFLEYRTERDQTLQKAAAAHFRRFIRPVDFIERISRQGFTVKYSVEGFGLAKYRQDDAHIARMIVIRR